MSGPVDEVAAEGRTLGMRAIEVREGRTTNIGRLGVVRVLPTKRRRTIGPWCFVDLMSPDDVSAPPPLEIGPHPHIGLATVTWLLTGSALHSDSLGTEQLIRPGQLNLMTSGGGIAHSEEGVGTHTKAPDHGIMGVQMWLAQTETTRHGYSSFQHIDEVPRVEFNSAEGLVLIGEIAGVSSEAQVDHPTIGLDLTLGPALTLPIEASFEHGVVPLDSAVKVDDAIVEPGSLAIVPPGRETLTLETRGPRGRVMVLGGQPIGEEVTMWWNFVARSRTEITDAWKDWSQGNEDRFGPVPTKLERIEAPTPPWVRHESE